MTDLLDGLDGRSRSFAVALFAAVPMLREHAQAENGVLSIELQPGPARPDCIFWLSTDGDEITVGFGMMHTHFDWPAFPGGGDPIAFIQSLMADTTLIEDWTLGGRWARSATLHANERPDLEGMQPGHVAHIRSWSGTRDEIIRGDGP